MKHTLKEITSLYQETFYTTDIAPIALIAAILVGSRFNVPPVWLYLIGPSSGGKTALIECFSKVPFCTQVSDLTPNTFLSGMSNSQKETSLLNRLGNRFTIIMKDFTTILQKSEETQGAIIAQMREIYDGHITKETGTGTTLEWGNKEIDKKGHATFIMAATEAIYAAQDKFADMGTRATNYVLLPQDRIETTKRALRNNSGLERRMAHLQDVFCEFVMERVDFNGDLPYVGEELENELIEIADFSSMCRSVVRRDYKGAKSLALSPEMPPRIAKQLLSLTQFLTQINGGEFEPYMKDAVFKTGMDSIPKQRRLVLEALARYPRVTESGVANYTNYPPERCREWIEDLNMFGVCDRIKAKDKQYWTLKPQYRKTMVKYLKIAEEKNDLEGEDAGGYNSNAGNYGDIDLSYEARETLVQIDESANLGFNNL